VCRYPRDLSALTATCQRRLSWLAVPWCLLFLSLARPAATQSRFDVWTTENGLPQNSINDIVQTRDGFLWLATYGGLVRFDGLRFVLFDRSIDGIESQRIRRLLEDRAGTLWAASEEGMLIRYRDGRFTSFSSEHGLPAANPVRFDESADGALWITSRTRVTRFDGGRAVSFASADFPAFARMTLSPYVQDVWWSQDESGLHVFLDGQEKRYLIDADVLRTGVTGVNRDRAGNVWVRTKGAGVVKIGGGRPERYTTRQGLPADDVQGHFEQDRHGRLWLGSLDGRIVRISNGTRELVSEAGLLTLFEDREGSVWLGTSAGLLRVRDFSVTARTQRDGLSSNLVYSILQARNGAVWIGTWGGGLNRYEKDRFSTSTAAHGLGSDYITSIHEDRSGRLWVGTTVGVRYLANDRFEPYEGGGLLGGQVWAIHEDRAGRLWFGTDTGLVRLADGRLTHWTARDGLSHDRISSLFEDRSGALWIGAFEGLTRLAGDTFTTYGRTEGFVGTHVRAIHEDRDGVLWVGTYDSGLYRLAGERLTRYTRRQGLHDNGIFQILEDDQGYLWTGSNRGIARLSRQELNDVADGRRRSVTPIVIGTQDGLLSLEANGGRQPAGWKTPDGRLWFPTMGGVAIVDPSAVLVNTHPPAALIEELQVEGRPADFTTAVRVPAGGSTFAIRYTAPSFIRPEDIRFRYRLDGLDDDWIEAGDTRTVTYHLIPPGEYVFRVIAANRHGIWNTTSASVRIVVLPPFWRTWWFAALVVGAVLAIALTGHGIRVRQLRREHARQTAFSRQLIDSQELERRRIANEMHDSLGQELAIIRQRARTASEQPADRDAVGKELEEIAGVAERIDAEVQAIAHGLRPYQLDTIGLSKTLDRMAHRVASAGRITCVTDIARIDDALPAGSQIHIYRIVQESLNNVVKHSKATQVQVTVARERNSLKVRVEDNGIGFRSPDRDGASAVDHGFGVTGMRERALMLGGMMEIQTSPGGGTTVSVAVPLESDQ
jgi:signal transduction histidine kinase/ligand-binding sensor domain-containing protein